MKITISLGSSRKSTDWKPITTEWGALVEKLASPKTTSETMEEYNAMDKETRQNAKDIGGFIGAYLYITFAYVVTHPVWRKNLQSYRAWKKEVRSRTLYPFRRNIAVSRTVLRASDADAVMDFYSGRLGYRMVARLRDPDSGKQTVLLQLGRSQAEFRCDPALPVPEGQVLAFTASKIPSILKRLRMNGIDVKTDTEDPCTDRRALVFEGPDGVQIMILEET